MLGAALSGPGLQSGVHSVSPRAWPGLHAVDLNPLSVSISSHGGLSTFHRVLAPWGPCPQPLLIIHCNPRGGGASGLGTAGPTLAQAAPLSSWLVLGAPGLCPDIASGRKLSCPWRMRGLSLSSRGKILCPPPEMCYETVVHIAETTIYKHCTERAAL